MLIRSFYALVAVAVAQTLYYFPQLPEVVASHFDGAGRPNAWSGRGGFFALYLAMVCLLTVVFHFAPRWSLRRGMKVPRPEYWLAPERIEQTRDWIRRQMLISGIAHLLLAIGVVQLAIEANLAGEARLSSSIWSMLGAYFVFLLGWLVHFFWHFRRS